MPEPPWPNPTASQSEGHDPGSGRGMQSNPGPTEDDRDATIGDQSPLTTSQQVNLWRANVEGPNDHRDAAKDNASKDDSLCEGSVLSPLHKLLQNIENDDEGSHKLEIKLEQWKDIINSRSPEDKETALHMAAQKGFLKTAGRLLAAGAEANARNSTRETPLHLACLYGHQQLVEKLLAEGADPELEDENGVYPLHSAVAQDFEAEVIQELLGRGGFIINKAVGTAQWTALNKAIYYEREGVVDVLLEGGARLDIKDADGWTPLMTAIKERQFYAFGKLLNHLDKTRISLDVVNEPDSDDVTPLMQLVSYEPEQLVTDATEHLLKFKPYLDVVDRDAKTVLHYAMASSKSLIQELPATALVYRLVRSLPAYRLLKFDKFGETAFDLAFEEGKRGPRPAFQSLLELLVDRVTESGDIEESLCWATYRWERHTIAQQLFQKKFIPEILQNLPKQDEDTWTIVEWAIYTRLPRVLMTYLRAFGLEKRAREDGDIHESIENGRKLIRDLKEQAQKSFSPEAEGKRDKMERSPPSGEDSQVLRDLADILYYLYPKEPEKPSNFLEILKPDQSMHDTLEGFRAAIVQRNFVKFRTIREVLYESDWMQHIRDDVQRLKRFEFNPKISSGQASETYNLLEAKSKNKGKFTWIHLPSNNMTWMEDTVKNILKQEGYESEAKKVASFLRSSWIEIPDRKSTSRFMRPRYVSNKTDHPTKSHEDAGKREPSQTAFRSQHNEHQESASRGTDGKEGSEGEQSNSSGNISDTSGQHQEKNQTSGYCSSRTIQTPITDHDKAKEGTSCALSAIYMPYLYFSTYHQSENEQQKDTTALPSELEKREKKVLDEINLRQKLFEAYKDSVVHQPTTLDEFYYQFPLDSDSVKDRNSRNMDQVVTKYLLREGIGTERYWPLLRVSQLWVWIINEKWLITSTSCATNDIRDNLVTDILKHLQRQVENGSRVIGPTSAAEMSRVIVDYCIGIYDRKRTSQDANVDKDRPLRAGDTTKGDQHRARTVRVDPITATDEKLIEERSIHQIFSDSINEIGRKESSLFSLSYGRRDGLKEPETGSGADDTSKMMEDLKDALKKVSGQLSHIKDIRDELNILLSIARFQRKVQSTMDKSQPREDLSSEYLVGDIKELDRFADQTQEAVKTTLTLQESEIANLQASESVKQGKVVLIFTLITVWFLPLSFLTSLFALDVESFMKAPAWALYIIFLVPLIFLGSAVVYVWKAKIKGTFARLGAATKEPSKEADLGTSTSRPIPSKVSLWRNRKRDVESGANLSE